MSKKRPSSHITGDRAIDIVKTVLPEQWVIRPLTPDYGIDLLVELFDFVDEDKNMCETLGEFLYIQVKGAESLEKKMIKVHPVYNVAKSKWKENKDEFIEVEVVSYSLDTSLLETVKRIGTSVCVLLFVVDTTTNDVYSICLNDVLDKLIQPRKPNYNEQGKITIHIPTDNKVDGSFYSLVPIRMYGKRSKLFSAFSLFRYQLKELRRDIPLSEIALFNGVLDANKQLEFDIKQYSDFVLFFANQVLQLDIWSIGDHLFALEMCELKLNALVTEISEGKLDTPHKLIHRTFEVWRLLDNLSSIYEEICREWFLPKFLAQLSSYENTPHIQTSK